MQNLKDNILKNIYLGVEIGQLENKELVQIIEHVGDLLNLRTRTQYAKEESISYNGAKKHRNNIVLFGCNFIVDNH